MLYVDSSALLRVVLDQPNRLENWEEVRTAISSDLLEVECLRTLDRLRLTQMLSDEETANRRVTLSALLGGVDRISVTSRVLARASAPFPIVLGTLDAIHLATAILWREEKAEELVIATHDASLALGAKSFGFPVIGI